MYTLIRGNLDRQARALNLLHTLQEEEISLLVARRTDEIMKLEFSIHELLRQIAAEKEDVIRRLGGGKVRDYAQMLPAEQKSELLDLWQCIDDAEQRCAKQATRNKKLSLGLLDQSKSVMDYLHSRLIPPHREAYSRTGCYTRPHPQAALISGHL